MSSALSSAATLQGITTSSHDFQNKTWNTYKSACGVCHTMHHANQTVAPLWTHGVSTATFTPYSSSTLNATVGAPTAISLACLSCHDGTVAVNEYGGSLKGTAEYATELIGPDLSDDHPVGFVYDAALATDDGYLKDPTTTMVTGPDFTGTKTIDQIMLFNHKMECASCHDIHNQRGASRNSGIHLIMTGSSYAGSKLCLTCHNK
ncbi:MAG: cytochrome C [Verrucomicrobia bacterium]|nr:cytochrome C [Verrucomicrobiota bacterium]